VTKSRFNSEANATGREGFVSSWVRFWFSPTDPIALHRLRFLFGIFFLASLLPLAGHENELLGLSGWFDQQAYADIAGLPEGSPFPVSWSIYYWCGTNSTLVSVAFWSSILAIALFTVGVCTRITSVLSWVGLTSFASNPAMAYDGDFLLTVPAMYLMIGYVLTGQRHTQSLSSRLLSPPTDWRPLLGRPAGESTPSIAVNLAVRLLQVHFAIVMVASGLHKLQVGEWWGGVAFWYPLYPPLETTADMLRRHLGDSTPFFTMLSVAAYATLGWQIGFPFFAWRPRWRPILIGGAALAWLGNAFLYRLPLFGPGIFIWSLSYLMPEEWRRVSGWIGRLPGLGWLEKEAWARMEEPGVLRPTETVAS
jgi:hypothetical protein